MVKYGNSYGKLANISYKLAFFSCSAVRHHLLHGILGIFSLLFSLYLTLSVGKRCRDKQEAKVSFKKCRGEREIKRNGIVHAHVVLRLAIKRYGSARLSDIASVAQTTLKLGKLTTLKGCINMSFSLTDTHEAQVQSEKEPTKHQYDSDAATSFSFLQKYGLLGEFKLNIECNHATLAGHSCFHELETLKINGILGNIDANPGDPQIGWDTDQILTDISEATLVMLSVIRNDGLAPGGFNFDAKLRRESTDVEDIFLAHISGMDTLARGLRNAAKLIEDGSLDELVHKRYESFDSEIGALIEAGKDDFATLEKVAMESGEPPVKSGKQELVEMIFQSTL